MLQGGVIGFGNVGRGVTRRLQDGALGARIVAVCNRGAEKLKAAAEMGLWTTPDAEELCARPDLDFVCVLSNNYAHCAQVEAAARHGKHVFCEKPVALTMAEADRMVQAVEKAGVINVVNYTNHYRKSFRMLEQMKAEGKFGRIWSATFNNRRGFGLYVAGARHRAVVEPEESGGWIVHHATHAVDALEWFAGPAAEVFCLTATTAPQDSPEFVHACLRHEGGAVSAISESLVKITGSTFEVQGEAGSAWLEVLSWKETKVRYRGESYVKPAPDDEWLFEDSVGTAHGFKHFLECVREKKMSPVDIKAGRDNLCVCLALAESAKTGRPVKVQR